MLRSVLLATFRGQLRPALAWGIALAIFALFSMWTNWRNEYPNEEARQRLAQQIESGGLGFSQVLFGEPRRVDQFADHVEWRALGLYPLLLGLFMVIAATGVSRGAEERGELDLLLAVPRGRTRLFAEQAGGLALALALACSLIWLAVLLSGPVAGEPVPSPGRAALSVLNVGLTAALFGTLALLVAQFTRTRRAAGMSAGAALVAAFLWANLGLVATALEDWRWLSPLYLYSRSTPLATGHVSLGALALTASLTLACGVLGGWLVTRRDLGAAARLPLPASPRRPARAGSGGTWLLGNGLQWGLRAALGPALVWGVGLAVYAALFTAVTPSFREAFADLPETQEAVQRIEFELTSDSGIISSVLFLTLPLLVAIFAVMLAGGAAGEEQAGRLELELAAPVPRHRYFLQRAGAALAAIALTVMLITAGFLGTALVMGLDLQWGRAVGAALLVALPAWVVAAFGYALAGWRPPVVTGIVAAAVAGSFFFDLLAPPLDLPSAVRKLSVFQLYGRPLLDGIRWGDVAAMLALIVVFLVAGSAAFTRRDILK